MIIPKYDCFLVTLKITPWLASKVALFYGTSLLIQHMLICLFYFYWIHLCGKWGLPKDDDLKSACNPEICS